MSELRELYQEVILDHGKRPRNFRKIEAGRSAEGVNPLCGDQFVVYATLDGEGLADLAFEGSGCAISTASASMMTELAKGKSREEFGRMFEAFHSLVTGGASKGDVGKLAVFAGVSEYPMRVKCATLAWHALKAVVEGSTDHVSTE